VKVVVSGSGGFIGSAVKRWLDEAGHTAIPYDLTDGNDIRDLDKVREVSEGCDAFIHMAGVLGTHELFDTPFLAIDTNITGSVNVLEACRHNGLAYVGITMPQVFPSLYTATKVASTRFATAYHNTWGVPVSHVRAFNAFGPGQHHGPGHPQKIIPTFAVEAWAGREIPVWGDGTQTVDLVHTNDLARMLVDAIQFGDDNVFDGGTGIPFTVNEVVHMVSIACECPVQVKHLPMRRGEEPTHIVAEGEGWDLLGWKPEFRMDDLIATVHSYRDHPCVST
jgi:UDP-glucose 4-epimerase